jgi:YggT family protein
LGNFINGIASVLNLILTLFVFMIIFRVLFSWINLSPYHPLVELLYKLTEPVLSTVRRKLSLRIPVDISPIIVIIIIVFLQSFLVGSLRDISVRLRTP